MDRNHGMSEWLRDNKYSVVNFLAHVNVLIMCALIGHVYLIVGVVVGWLVSLYCHYLYMHRVLIHGHFKWGEVWREMGLLLFCTQNMGSPAVHAAVHVAHHKYSGNEKDPHDPIRLGFWKTLLGIWDDKFRPDHKAYRVFLKDQTVAKYHRRHFDIAVLTMAFFPIITVVGFWMTKFVVWTVHLDWLGYGKAIKDDNSKNVWWLKPITWGEELHNNHHVDQRAANHNFKGNWKEFDLLYHIGRLIEKYGK